MKSRLLIFSVIIISTLQFFSCVHKAYVAPIAADGNYPQDIARILVDKCATAGCHNAASYTNAGGLRLDTWDYLFDGGNNGAEVVPYSVAYSPLLYFVNTDSSLGPVATPTMPYSTTSKPQLPLTKAEYETLVKWIANGAPDKNGNIAFSSDPATRQKIYITQQGCDLMAVIDAQKHVVMRYIPIGAVPGQTESPHCTRVSNDGAYSYVSFLYGNYLQKIDTRTDQVVGAANVGSLRINGSWNILYVAPNDSAVVTSSWMGDGLMAYINATTMSVVPARTLGGGGTLVYPHGITSVSTFDTFFITAQYGNVVYKISADGMLYKMISLNGNPPATSTDSSVAAPNPHEIIMATDHNRYFVTCQGTNEVVVMDSHRDTVIKRLRVGIFPQEMAISRKWPYVFVTCMEDVSTQPGMKGTVYAINYETYEMTIINGDFYQPHGLAVDDRNGLLYVVSTNSNPTGPAPHHATSCSGRAGWYSIIDMNTLKFYNNRRYQLTVLPYSASCRFIE